MRGLLLAIVSLVLAPSIAPSIAAAQDESSALGEPMTPEQVERALRRPALLDQRFGDASDGRSERFHGWASIAFYGGSITLAQPIQSLATRLDSGDAVLIAPSLGARLAMTRELDVSFEWTAAYASTRVRGSFDGESAAEPIDGEREVFAAGNPVLQATYTHDWSILSLSIGLGAALPVAALEQAGHDVPTAIDRAASVLAYELLLATHAALDPWRFFPERLSFVLPVRIAMGDRLGGGVEVVGAWTIPVLGSQTGSQHEGAVQVAGDVSYEIIPELRVGVRGSVTAWRIGRPDGPVRTQGALEPWVRATFGPAFGTLRATLDLGGDYGLGTGAGVWAIHVGGGAWLDADPE